MAERYTGIQIDFAHLCANSQVNLYLRELPDKHWDSTDLNLESPCTPRRSAMSLWDRLFRRQQRDEELDEEVQAHLQMAEQERMERGETAEQARSSALREFGNVGVIKEMTRDTWGFRWLDELLQDLRYGLLMLAKNPSFTVVAVLSLALGIGANTAIFSVINAVMLRMLPVHDPERLVQVAYDGQHDNQSFTSESFSFPNFKELHERNQVFTDMAAAAGGGFPEGFPEPPKWTGQYVTANFFSVLGVNAVIGRVFAPDEDKEVHAVVVISYALWTSRFGRDPQAIGHTMTLSGMPFAIIGVAPAHFSGLDPGQPYDLWVCPSQCFRNSMVAVSVGC
jgi:hypothetical protein